MYYPRISFMEFVKTASSAIGPSVMSVPAKMASDAFSLYNSLPTEDRVKVAYNMYQQVKPGFNKVAMEMVAANVLADIDRREAALEKVSAAVEDVKKNESDRPLTPHEELYQRYQGSPTTLFTYKFIKGTLDDAEDIQQRTNMQNMYAQGFGSI